MYDDCITTARSMIFARYAQHYTLFNSDLRDLEYERARKQSFGSWYVTKYQEICSTRLKEVAEFVFNIYEQNLEGLGISFPGP